MGTYRLKVQPESAWATPWHADTVFGCLCWAYRDAHGAEKLEEVLQRYLDGDPVFVLSNAFPAGLLPYPVGAKLPEERAKSKVKPVWARVGDVMEWAQGKQAELGAAENPFVDYALAHASIGRTTLRADEGQLFEVDRQYWRSGYKGEPMLEMYVECAEGDAAGVRALFELLALRGFGRKGRSGLGQFSVAGWEEWKWPVKREEAKGFVGLSHWTPRRDDPREGRYHLHVTHPKFQGNEVQWYAKGTLTMLKAGSVFRVNGGCGTHYGRAVPMKRDGMEKALHYGFCLPMPVLRDDWR